MSLSESAAGRNRHVPPSGLARALASTLRLRLLLRGLRRGRHCHQLSSIGYDCLPLSLRLDAPSVRVRCRVGCSLDTPSSGVEYSFVPVSRDAESSEWRTFFPRAPLRRLRVTANQQRTSIADLRRETASRNWSSRGMIRMSM